MSYMHPSVKPELPFENGQEINAVDYNGPIADNQDDSLVVYKNDQAASPPSQSPSNKTEAHNPFKKPNVLLHYIDGFIIEEADFPYRGGSNSLLTRQQLQDIWKKQQELIAEENEQATLNSEHSTNTINGNYPIRKGKQRCEVCGGISEQPYSNRFCSLLCSRRHNAKIARQFKLKARNMKLKDKNEEEEYFDTPPLSPVDPRTPITVNEKGETCALSPSKWTVDNVCDYIESLPDSKVFSCDFRNHEIDGSALLLIKEDHLISSLNIKLGPALKLCSHIRKLQDC